MCAIQKLCDSYLDNVAAYVEKGHVLLPDGTEQEPDESFMLTIEEKMEIDETLVDDFRRQIFAFLHNLAIRKKQFSWNSNPRLAVAFKEYLISKIEIPNVTLDMERLAVVCHGEQLQGIFQSFPILADTMEEAGIDERLVSHLKEDSVWCGIPEAILKQKKN